MEDDGAVHFAGADQGVLEHWRSIVLFGRNVASYKFALAKSLLEVAREGKELILLEELAPSFSRNICEHLATVDRQGTFAHSKFLDACRFYNAGRISDDELHTATTLLGFNNVIDAFHVVGQGDVPTRFFVDDRTASQGIRLSDDLLAVASSDKRIDLNLEAESRWRLVEESWSARAEGKQVTVLYDAPRELLIPALQGKRKSITEVRPALNGYQKGHCFYCFRSIALVSGSPESPDVDHFLPHSLMSRGFPLDLDAPWNLVLACQTCNRGASGKFAFLPDTRYLRRLHHRNEFLISSNHPLRETLILATGNTAQARQQYLMAASDLAAPLVEAKARWSTEEVQEALF